MDWSKHPIQFILEMPSKQDFEFAFSKYRYEPDSLIDERVSFRISGAEVTEAWLESVILGLETGQELALSSTVRHIHSKRTLHFPMIDFSIPPSESKTIYDRLVKYLSKEVLMNMYVYNSGRSLHAYSATLLTKPKWIDFMGRLLLVNPQGRCFEVVDTRWVGHRLMGGFASLRWSNSSGLYLSYPQKIKYP